jgi:hypothetical protein
MRIDKRVCLCCGQVGARPGKACDSAESARECLDDLRGLGYSLEALMDQHRDQIDYQAPGLAEWIKKIALT